MSFGTNIIKPAVAAAAAVSKTAAAARSLARFMASSYSGDTRSAIASMAELNASAASTPPMQRITIIHSVGDMRKTAPAAMAHTAAAQCIHALCSVAISDRIPANA